MARSRRRGFSLIELAIALTILVSVSSVAYLILRDGGAETAEVGATYAENYTGAISESTNAGNRLPTSWTCPADRDSVFTLTLGNGVTDADSGTYIFRCTGNDMSNDYFSQELATGNMSSPGGPWQPAF